MVRRRLTNLGLPNHCDCPGTPRTATVDGGDSGVGIGINDHGSNGRSSSSSGACNCLGKSKGGSGDGGGGGGGRARALARSCLALSVARQADLWPVLRAFSEKNQKNGSESGAPAAAAALPVVYVAGELDGRYGGRPSSVLPAPGSATEAAAAAVKVAAAAAPLSSRNLTGDGRVVRVGGVPRNGVARAKSGAPRGGNGSIATSSHTGDNRGTCAVAAGETVGAGSGGMGAGAVALPGSKTVAGIVAATCPGVGVAVLPGCGHAVPAEAPATLFQEVAKLSAVAAAAAAAAAATAAAAAAAPSTSGASPAAAALSARTAAAAAAEKTSGARIVGFSLEEFSIPMVAPLQLSLCRLTGRQGVLVRLEGALPPRSSAAADDGPGRGARGSGENSRRRVWGVGEVTPLPGEQAKRACVCL